MGGSAFAAKGATTGQAPTSVFFGAFPDKFTLLRPTGPKTNPLSLAQANFVNLWEPFNASFDIDGGTNADTVTLGAMTTAPDGTNTAQKIVEATTTALHLLNAEVGGGQIGSQLQNGGFQLRLAVFAKAAERTRIVLALGTSYTGTASTGSNTIKVVFDLANGAVGPNSSFNNTSNVSFTLLNAAILPFGNGWYCCQIDVSFTFATFPNQLIGAVVGGFYLDSGSGNAAANVSYTGDGSSGVYAWKSTCLPPAAWALSNTRIFFDDFTSLGTIDLTNSKAPGFKWYINNIWPAAGQQAVNGVTPSNPSLFSVNNSVLTIQPSGSGNQTIMGTAVWTGGMDQHSFIGQTFTPPFIVEMKMSFNTNTSGWDIGLPPLLWSTAMQGMLPPNSAMLEFDLIGGGAPPSVSGGCFWFPDGLVPLAPIQASGLRPNFWGNNVGYGIWENLLTYRVDFNEVVFYAVNSNVYACSGFPPAGTVPTNATYWSQVTPPMTQRLDLFEFDASVMHVYTTVVLPSTPTDPAGYVMNWMDGNPASSFPNGTGAGATTSILYQGISGMPPATTWTAGKYDLRWFQGDSLSSSVDYISVSQ